MIVASAVDEGDEEDGGDGEGEAVEPSPGAPTEGLALRQVLLVADVLDGGHGKVEPLGELDAADDGERHEPVDELHKAGDPEDEYERRGEDAGGHHLGDPEGGVGEGDGGDGLHGLDGHGDAVEESRDGVVDAGEDEGGAEVEAAGERQREHDGDVCARSPMAPFSSGHTDWNARLSRARASSDLAGPLGSFAPPSAASGSGFTVVAMADRWLYLLASLSRPACRNRMWGMNYRRRRRIYRRRLVELVSIDFSLVFLCYY